jgi:phenylacetate-CoA ligase
VFAALGTSSSAPVDALSGVAAQRAARIALRRVPAYRAFVEHAGWRDDPALGPAAWVATLPVTDKETYIRPFPVADRCLDGRLPAVGTQIDESSGSSGTPFNWVRSGRELAEVHRSLAQLARRTFSGRIVGINAFSMGAWATGTNVGEAMRLIGIVKSPGPDIDKILETFEFLGPGYVYVVTGYPPFLAELLDAGSSRGFDWARFRMYGIVGGEGMSEQLRDRLERAFIAVYSAYGASDLDIGVAAEFPLSVALRRAAAERPELRRALFGDDPRLPMVFQYNPYDYYVETNADRELLVTVNRLALLSPRIRYNIHDQGGRIAFADALATCRAHGVDLLSSLPAGSPRPFRLPFLFVHGRADSTISFMGANIYPEDVEQALLGAPAVDVRGFCLELIDLPDGLALPCIHVALDAAAPRDDGIGSQLAGAIRERLLANSRDYQAAVEENPRAAELVVRLHAVGTGPFADDASRLKRRYIVRS